MKGICFKEPLFHLTVQGIKKQTRRIMKPQPDDSGLHNHTLFPLSIDSDMSGFWGTVEETGEYKEFKPRYKVGEIVYLKEPYSWISLGSREPVTVYKYDNEDHEDESGCSFLTSKWKNKLFMPESEARHFIKITDVRAERLQDISNSDCIKEGIFKHISHAKVYWKNGVDGLMYGSPRYAYAALIDLINGKGTWDSNPFVFVYDYELLK